MGTISKLPQTWQKPVGERLSKTLTFFRILSWALAPRSKAKGLEASAVLPALEETRPTDTELLHYALTLASQTAGTYLTSIDRMTAAQAAEAQRWPGYNYRLLKALVADQRPQLIVEIGTDTGLSALAMLEALPAESRIVTYDLIPWDSVPNTVLKEEDFARGLEQRLGDLCEAEYFASQREVILEADLFYMDGPKDARFEASFMAQMRAERRKAGLMIWDDIRLLGMIELWRTLDLPKLDLTSFGHWTGTGVVRIGQSE